MVSIKNIKFLFSLSLLIIISCNYSTRLSGQTVRTINFEGNTKTKTKTLKRIILCEIGEQFDSTMIAEDNNKISRLSGIATSVYTVSYRNENEIDVVFNVIENFSIIPIVNLWNTDSSLAFQVGIYDVNLFGRNVVLGGYYQKNYLSSFELNFAAPHLFSRSFGLELNVKRLATYEPLYRNDLKVLYEFRNNSNEILLTYNANATNNFKIGASIFQENYMKLNTFDEYNSSSFPNNVILNKRLYKLNYEYNNMNYHYYFVKGVRNSFNLQVVNTVEYKTKPFIMVWNDFHWFKRIGKDGNIATRFRIGLATNTESPFAPYALDNQLNIRGIGNLVKRGTGSLVWNSEYRLELISKKWFTLQGNTFIDMGSIRNPGESIKSFTLSDNIDIHTGVGLRFIHNKIFNAILRIDYGIGITKESSNGFVLGIGQYF